MGFTAMDVTILTVKGRAKVELNDTEWKALTRGFDICMCT
jgi:hypothetical protein